MRRRRERRWCDLQLGMGALIDQRTLGGGAGGFSGRTRGLRGKTRLLGEVDAAEQGLALPFEGGDPIGEHGDLILVEHVGCRCDDREIVLLGILNA